MHVSESSNDTKPYSLNHSKSLLDAVDGLLHSRELGPALSVELLVARRQVRKDHLTINKLALQVSGDEVDATYHAAIARSV